MASPIEKRRGKTACKWAGCQEPPTIQVYIRMVAYDPQRAKGEPMPSHSRSRTYCDVHAESLFERLEDLLDHG